MKRYYYHPDHIIYIFNEEKTYYENLVFAKFDLGANLQFPPESHTEFEYIVGYGTRNFSKGNMTSFSPEARQDLDKVIEDIDLWIEKKKQRENTNESVWEIPDDMLQVKGDENAD